MLGSSLGFQYEAWFPFCWAGFQLNFTGVGNLGFSISLFLLSSEPAATIINTQETDNTAANLLSSVGHGFHIMKWHLNSTKYWLIAPTSFVSWLHQHLLQVTLVDYRVYGWLGVTFLPWLCVEYLPVPGILVHRGEGLDRNQLDFSVFNKLYSCCLQQWVTTISL